MYVLELAVLREFISAIVFIGVNLHHFFLGLNFP